MHGLLLWAVLALYAAAVVNLVSGQLELRRFGERVTMISSERDLDLFKDLAASQMRRALVQMVLLGLPAVLVTVAVARGALGPGGLLYVVLPAIAIIVVSLVVKGTEKRIQEIPTADESLAARRDEVVRTWLKKAVPDW